MTQQDINEKLNKYILKMEAIAETQTELHRYLDAKNKARAARRALVKLNKSDVKQELKREIDLFREAQTMRTKLAKLVD